MNERKKESALERQRRLVATLPQTPEQVARLTPCAALGKGAKPVWCGHCRQTVMPGDACASGVTTCPPMDSYIVAQQGPQPGIGALTPDGVSVAPDQTPTVSKTD